MESLNVPFEHFFVSICVLHLRFLLLQPVKLINFNISFQVFMFMFNVVVLES